MQALGRGRWIAETTVLKLLVFSGLFHAAELAVLAALGALEYVRVSWPYLGGPVLLLLPLAWLSARYHWSACEQSIGIQGSKRPT